MSEYQDWRDELNGRRSYAWVRTLLSAVAILACIAVGFVWLACTQ